MYCIHLVQNKGQHSDSVNNVEIFGFRNIQKYVDQQNNYDPASWI
jgi:hypothetical protein